MVAIDESGRGCLYGLCPGRYRAGSARGQTTFGVPEGATVVTVDVP